MGPNPIAILSIIGSITATVADVTLYGVAQTGITEYDSATISAVGVDSGGSTTYVESGVKSLIMQLEGTTTRTLLSTPITYTGMLTAISL
ncbi:hypothetical protein BD779DRAFT_1568662, partial [Infundibulicybe gibba]